MQIDPDQNSAGSRGTDTLIVGSGPIGMAVALRLAARGIQVTVLEAGSAITDPPGSHFRNQQHFQDNPDAYFGAIEPYLSPVAGPDVATRLPGVADSSAIGGQGILWTNNCPRASGFERWDAMSPARWERCYAAAEELLGVEPETTASSATGQAVKSTLSGVLEAEGRQIRDLPLSGHVSPDGAIHFNGPLDMLEAAGQAERERIAIRSDVRVTRLVHTDGRVSGVETVGADNSAGTFEAARVVVAGGAVATPRLLHGSGIRPAALGRGISFHALLFGQIALAPGLCPAADETDVAMRAWIPPTADAPWHIQVLRDTCPFPAKEPVDNPHRLLEFQAFVPVGFREDSAFVIGDDAQGTFAFSFTDKDRERMRALEADTRRLADELGRWRRGCEPVWVPHGTSHLVGTCRMDREGWDGVADRTGKVHGFDNLYLATVGLIPAPVAVNPTLTGVALAVNTCEAITGAG